ncbi:MAG: sigma 54-interacting transcriptional regulator [Gemmataceae bacterium]
MVSAYSLYVLYFVQTIPDLGLRTIFTPVLRSSPQVRPHLNENQVLPQRGDQILSVGDISLKWWPHLLNAPFRIERELRDAKVLPGWAKEFHEGDEHGIAVDVRFKREGVAQPIAFWCVLGEPPLEDVVPSVLWFVLKFALFLVGALVLWKRPTDKAAAQFFLLCIVTLGAFIGGYHFTRIATQPPLLVVFMVCAVMLPAINLHFYLLFPRPKPWLVTHRRRVLAFLYGVPAAFLVLMLGLYLRLRFLIQADGPNDEISSGFELLEKVIFTYFGVASLNYLGCIVALAHSFGQAQDAAERNQVKTILYGALLALPPIAYSLYIVIWDPDAFGAGATTWPMFTASACVTAAFAVAITRYRLMELDKIISSGMGYFLVSFLAAVLYYGVVFVATLIFNQVIVSPRLSEALMVSTTALVLMMALDVARSRIKKALDRRFYKEKTQLDRTLQRMGQAIQQLVEPPALAQRLLQATSEFLGVARGAIFLRQGEPALYVLAGSLGPDPALRELPPGCPLVEALEQGRPVLGRMRGHPEKPEQRQLQFLGGEVAHPLLLDGRLLALLVLGPKDSPYRAEDLDLLSAFAQITAPAIQSAQGHQTIEQLNKELHAKVEKISEQQRRILALQTQLRRQVEPVAAGADGEVNGQALEPAGPTGGIVGSGPVVRELLGLIRKVAVTDAVVLIRGESGTGKELLARAVHENSPRAGKPFVKVHCAALSANLLESELFGHVKGAFTGAHRDKVGRFELANGGTLFLDEIGDISLEVQTKLLRVLQERVFERVGSSDPVQVDVRILTATHQNLEDLIRVGRFREDLFYRLNVFPIRVPALRDHLEDVPELTAHFVRQFCQRFKKEPLAIEDDVLACLKSQPWPGNIRQLENVIERAVVIAEGAALTVAELPPELQAEASERFPFATSPEEGPGNGAYDFRGERDRQERDHLVRALTSAKGNKAEAARALGMARSTLVSKLKKLGLG